MTDLPFAPILGVSVWQIVSESSAFGVFILIVLAAMSVLCWAVIFTKWRQFKEVESDNAKFLYQFSRTRSLQEAATVARSSSRSMLASMFQTAVNQLSDLYEIRQKNPGPTGGKLDDDDFEIVEMTMERAEVEQLGKLEKRVVLLATTANSAPFLGLLGTVVGIMDAFWAIGERGSASLAIVAPGIAEALLATIVGLGAAIPAVMAYNWANARMKALADTSNTFILDFLTRAKKENR